MSNFVAGIGNRCERLGNGLGITALAAIALTPLVLDPGAWDDAYLTPKWAWIAIWTALGWAGVGMRALRGKVPVMVPLQPVAGVALLFCLWHWVGVGWAASRSLAVDRAAQITWLTLVVGLGFQELRRRRALVWMAWAAIALGTVTALWVLLEDAVRVWLPGRVWLRPNLPDWRGYLSAGLGNTNHIGDLLALTFLVTLMAWGEARRRRWVLLLGACATVQPAALIVCYSVGSNLGLVAGAALLLIGYAKGDRGRWFARRWKRWAVMGAVWLGLAVFFNLDIAANPHRPGILRVGFGSERWQEGGPTRLVIWAEGLEMLRQHPLLGVGTGNFTYKFPEMDSALLHGRPDLMRYQGRWTNAAHNELLQAWAEMGIIGLMLLAALLATAWYALLKDPNESEEEERRRRIGLAALLAVWVLHAQMNFALQTPVGALSLYALLLAVVLESHGRATDVAMPSLRWETGWCALRVDSRSMRQPTALGAAFIGPPWLGLATGLVIVAAVAAWIPHRLGPVRAQREYHRAMQSLVIPRMAEDHFLRALALDPDAEDVRSKYSSWLLEQSRPVEALDQLKTVRQRLNSNELWEREARAWSALGDRARAEEAYRIYLQRFWSARQARPGR